MHDKWQVRPDVTLDLGLRHELYIPLVGYTPVGGQATYDPDTNTIRVAGYGDIPENLGVKTYWKNFNPRTGMSWRLNDANVLRAGYGVSALGLPSSWGQDFPIRQIQQITPANSFAPTTTKLATGLPAPAFVPIPRTASSMRRRCVQRALDVIDPNRTEGTLHSFNIAYQRTLPAGFTAEIAYVGNRGHDILAAYNMNAGLVARRRQRRPAAVREIWKNRRHVEPGAGQVGVQLDAVEGRPPFARRSAPDQLVHAGPRATVTPMATAAGRSPRRPTRNVGISARRSTRRIALSSSFVYMMPWGPDGKWLQEGAIGKVLGDWQVTGVVLGHLGHADRLHGECGGSARARQHRIRRMPRERQKCSAGSGRALWFDTSVFSAPAAATWGNVERRGLLNGPALLQPRRVNREDRPCGNEARRDSRGLLQCAEHPALRQSERHAGQRELRPHHGYPGADRARDFGSEDASCSDAPLEDWKIGGLNRLPVTRPVT